MLCLLWWLMLSRRGVAIRRQSLLRKIWRDRSLFTHEILLAFLAVLEHRDFHHSGLRSAMQASRPRAGKNSLGRSRLRRGRVAKLP